MGRLELESPSRSRLTAVDAATAASRSFSGVDEDTADPRCFCQRVQLCAFSSRPEFMMDFCAAVPSSSPTLGDSLRRAVSLQLWLLLLAPVPRELDGDDANVRSKPLARNSWRASRSSSSWNARQISSGVRWRRGGGGGGPDGGGGCGSSLFFFRRLRGYTGGPPAAAGGGGALRFALASRRPGSERM